MHKMKVVIGIQVFTAFIVLTAFAANVENTNKLVFAQVLYRHGNRTPSAQSLYDPLSDPIYWPEGYYTLTNEGKQLQFELGQYLRRRYNDLIGPGYDSKKVYIRSSDTDRTLMSAAANAAGLFPPSGDQIWNEYIDWQPVPIHTVKLEDDFLVYQSIPCDKADKMYDELLASETMTAFFDEYNGLLKTLNENTGISVETNSDKADAIITFYQALNREKERGLPLPDWAQNMLKFDNDKLDYISAVVFALKTHTTEMKKAKTGHLIKEIFDRFRNKTLSLLDPDRSAENLFIYSGHDNTIVNVLNALNVFEPRDPPFGAIIQFELSKHGDEYYMQLFYRTDNSEHVPPIEIPDCGTKCPLSRIFELYKNILPTEDETYESLCRLSSTDITQD